jgi:hypothetical protein
MWRDAEGVEEVEGLGDLKRGLEKLLGRKP